MQNFLRQLLRTPFQAAVRTLTLPLFFALSLIYAVVDLISFCPSVAMVQCRNSLCEHFPNEVLADVVLGLSAPPDELLEVAAIAVLHYDEDLGSLLVYYSIVILHYVRVAQLAQNIDFRNNLLFFLFTHDSVIELLPNEHFAVRNSPHFLHFAEAP